MAKAGWDVLIGRDDIEAVGYDPYITMPDLQAALRDTDGIALSLTPLKAPEIAAAPRLRVAARIGVGYDAVDIPALTARGIPLMVVGTANSVTRRRARDLHDVCARQEGDVPGRGGARQPLAGPLEGRAGRSRREDDPDRRLRPHRHAHRQALPRDGHDRAGLRSLCAGRDHQGGGLRAGRAISTPRCRAPTSSASIARRRPRRSACSTRRASRA